MSSRRYLVFQLTFGWWLRPVLPLDSGDYSNWKNWIQCSFENFHFCNLKSVSGLQTAAIAYMGEFHSNKTRSKYVTLATMFMAVSIIYMSVLGWLIIPSEWSWNIYGFEYKPWRLFIFCNSLILLASFCGLLVMPESPKFMLAMGKKNEALDILRWVYEYNTGKSREVCRMSSM